MTGKYVYKNVYFRHRLTREEEVLCSFFLDVLRINTA